MTVRTVPTALFRRAPLLLLMIFGPGLLGCDEDSSPTGPPMEEEQPTDELLELMLTARDTDDQPLAPNGNGEIDVAVGEVFALEVSYSDLRSMGADIGAFHVLADLLVGEPGVLEPVLSETFDLTVGGEVLFAAVEEPASTITFGLEGSASSYDSPAADFVTDPRSEVVSALSVFGFVEGEDYTLTGPEYLTRDDLPNLPTPEYPAGTSAVDTHLRIRWNPASYGGVDAPDLLLIPNFTDPVPVQTVEFSPVGPDGVSINADALRFNVDVASRTFNGGETFYDFGVQGSFDPATGFTAVGGTGKVPFGDRGIRDLTDDGGFIEPFDAFRLMVRVTAPVDGLEIRVNPAQDPESILLYGRDQALEASDVWVDSESVVTVNAVSR